MKVELPGTGARPPFSGLVLNMHRRLAAALFATSILNVNVAPVHAGSCGKEIARFESSVRASRSNPAAGPMAPQSVGAQLGRQPTPESVERSDEKAQAAFNAVLASAKKLDAEGKRAGCMDLLGKAKQMYNLQ